MACACVRIYLLFICIYSPYFKIVNCLSEWKLGHESKVPFTGEQYESVHQAMTALMDELEKDEYHGRKFRKLLKNFATDAMRFVLLLL